MLSVAHPENLGSGSGHHWKSDRSPNVQVKRRKTDQECYMPDKKQAMSPLESIKRFNLTNNSEITLTIISKNNNNNSITEDPFKELANGNIKTDVTFENDDVNQESEKEEACNEKAQNPISPLVIDFIKNSNEIQLTRVGSNEKYKFTQNDSTDVKDLLDEEATDPDITEKAIDTAKENNILDTIKSIELSEVTIEACPSTQKTKTIKSPSTPNPSQSRTRRYMPKTHTKLNNAQDYLLKKRECPPRKASSFQTFSETTDSKVSPCPEPDQIFEFDSKSDLTGADYEPFNVGIPCERFYSNKDKPHFTTGFPNPPGENRCWINATLQALFALPVFDKFDVFEQSKCSRLMASLMSIQTFWYKGNTGSHAFDQAFQTYKEELSALDKLYSSKAQQDVSEFVMNLLNFIKTEYENLTNKESHSSEIENIPYNDQDSLRRSQGGAQESNKRLPLADISSSPRQLRNNNVVKHAKSDNQTEPIPTPIDHYFSLYMTENYICDGCQKQRSQKVENLILFIDLPAEDNGSSVDLVDMINNTYALEHRNMTCQSCKHDMHSMVTKLKKLPKILTVQVKRYEMTNHGNILKKCTMVDIPKLLKLDSLVINNSEDFSYFPDYEPVGIISHIGDNIDSGHYISFVKHQDEWHYYDDMNVKILSVDEVFKCVQNNAYVIIFQDTKLEKNTETSIDQRMKKESITC